MSSTNQKILLKEQLKNLEHVQELDLKIDQIKKKKADLPVEVKNLEANILKLSLQIETKNSEKEEINKNFRQVQAAVELNEDRASRAQAKLEGVSSGDEFQAATKELEQLKKFNESFLEQRKKIQESMDAITLAVDGIQTNISDLKEQKKVKLAEIASQEGTLNTDMNQLLDERNGYIKNIEKPTLARYDRIRGAREGVGLAPASHGRCNSCNMMIPPQLFNQLIKSQDMIQCPSCQRILYYLE